jgi:hypothetical protein
MAFPLPSACPKCKRVSARSLAHLVRRGTRLVVYRCRLCQNVWAIADSDPLNPGQGA